MHQHIERQLIEFFWIFVIISNTLGCFNSILLFNSYWLFSLCLLGFAGGVWAYLDETKKSKKILKRFK